MYATTEKTITIRGVSRITVTTEESPEGVEIDAAAFEGVINSADPLSMELRSYVVDPEVYKNNIAQCRADEDSFRDYAQEIQDGMLGGLTEE